MGYDSVRHSRRSKRLQGYDYTQAGAYFLTIVVHGRECLFGEVVDGEMKLSEHGKIVFQCWEDLPGHYRTVELDAFVVMPNHVHCIVILTTPDWLTESTTTPVGAGLKPAPTTDPMADRFESSETVHKKAPLSEIVRAFKTFSSRRINELRGTPGVPVWQRNYYEHVIRNEESLAEIREYVATNPIKWELDQLHPNNVSK